MPDDIIIDDPTVNPETPTEDGWIILDGDIIVGD